MRASDVAMFPNPTAERSHAGTLATFNSHFEQQGQDKTGQVKITSSFFWALTTCNTACNTSHRSRFRNTIGLGYHLFKKFVNGFALLNSPPKNGASHCSSFGDELLQFVSQSTSNQVRRINSLDLSQEST